MIPISLRSVEGGTDVGFPDKAQPFGRAAGPWARKRWFGLWFGHVTTTLALLVCMHLQAAIPPMFPAPGLDTEQACRARITANPADEEAILILSILLDKRGQIEQAVQILRAGVQARPDSAALNVALGCVEQRAGRLQSALSSFTAAVALPELTAEMAIECLDGFITAGAFAKACDLGEPLLPRFPDHERFADRVLKAMERAGRHERCLRLADTLLDRNPSWNRIRYRRARSLRLSGLREEARDIYISLLDKTAFDYDVCNELGSLCHEDGSLDQAEAFYKRGLRSKPTGSALLCNYADLLFRNRKDAAAAVPMYRDARTDAPYFEAAFLGQADALNVLGQSEAVLDVCTEAVRMLPWRPQAYFKAAGVLWYLGRQAEAEEWLRKGEACDLVSDDDRYGYAVCLNTFRKSDLARPLLEGIQTPRIAGTSAYCYQLYLALSHNGGADTALLARTKEWQQRFPQEQRFYFAWSRTAHALNNLDEAEDCVRQFELHNPPTPEDAPDYTEMLLRFYSELSLQTSKAAVISNALDTLVRLHPGNAAIQFECGRLAKALGRYPDAARHWQESIRLNPRAAGPYSELAQLIADPAQALPWHQKAAELEPNGDVFQSNLGFGLILCRKGSQAVEALLRAVEINSRNPVAWYNLALARTLIQDRRGAAEAYQRAKELDYVGNPDLQAQLDAYLDQHPRP